MELHYTLDEKDYRPPGRGGRPHKGFGFPQGRTHLLHFYGDRGGAAVRVCALARGRGKRRCAAGVGGGRCFSGDPAGGSYWAGVLPGGKTCVSRCVGYLGARRRPATRRQACTLRLQDGILYDEGPAVGPLAAKVTRPAAALRTVRTDSFGLVLVFRDGTGLGVPLSAFNREQPLPRWKQALEQAMAAPAPAGWAAAAAARSGCPGRFFLQGGRRPGTGTAVRPGQGRCDLPREPARSPACGGRIGGGTG